MAAMSRLTALGMAKQPEQKDVNVLCLGCSSGETSLDLLTELHVELQQIQDGVGRRVHMTALDISPSVIREAQKGIYQISDLSAPPWIETIKFPRVLRAPWIEVRGEIVHVRWDILRILGHTLDFRVFDIDQNLTSAFPDGTRFDLVETINCHNKNQENDAANIRDVTKPHGVVQYGGSFQEYQERFCKRRHLPDYLPPFLYDFIKTCTDEEALMFMAGIVEPREITAEENALLSSIEISDTWHKRKLHLVQII